MEVLRVAVLVALLVAAVATAEGQDAELRPYLQSVDGSAFIASLINPRIVTTTSRTSYGVPYDLEYPVCEVNRLSGYWENNYGIPPLGTWLLVRSRDTGQSTLCAVVGTFRFEADDARLLNISPRVAEALGVEVDDGLFDIVVEEHMWNVETLAATRRMLLEQPQDFFSRTERYLPLRDLDGYEVFEAAEAEEDDLDGDPIFPDEPSESEPTDSTDIPQSAAANLPPEGFARFPWPAPPPSVRPVEFPRRFYQEAHTLGLFDELLQEALRSVGYVEKSYYYVPSGFAVVTRLEQINGDATPKPDPERWPTELQTAHSWSIGAYLRLLFTSAVPAGYGRVLVFAVSDDDCVVASEACGGDRTKVDESTVRVWLDGGGVRLPPSMVDIPLSDAHAVWALVYEFEKPLAGEPYQTFGRDHQGETHLVRAGIWDYFDRR